MADKLDLGPRFADSDAAYRLIALAHRGLSEAESADLNARLVLVLANQIGDVDLLADAIRVAVEAGARSAG